MTADYEVINTQPYTYLDETGRVVNGVRVNFRMLAYSEVHFVNVPTFSQAPAEIAKMLAERKALGGATAK